MINIAEKKDLDLLSDKLNSLTSEITILKAEVESLKQSKWRTDKYQPTQPPVWTGPYVPTWTPQQPPVTYPPYTVTCNAQSTKEISNV